MEEEESKGYKERKNALNYALQYNTNKFLKQTNTTVR